MVFSSVALCERSFTVWCCVLHRNSRRIWTGLFKIVDTLKCNKHRSIWRVFLKFLRWLQYVVELSSGGCQIVGSLFSWRIWSPCVRQRTLKEGLLKHNERLVMWYFKLILLQKRRWPTKEGRHEWSAARGPWHLCSYTRLHVAGVQGSVEVLFTPIYLSSVWSCKT